jgi:hypothetical protein
MSIPLLDVVNRWRKEANSATGDLCLDIMNVDTTLEALLPTVLRFSKALQHTLSLQQSPGMVWAGSANRG